MQYIALPCLLQVSTLSDTIPQSKAVVSSLKTQTVKQIQLYVSQLRGFVSDSM